MKNIFLLIIVLLFFSCALENKKQKKLIEPKPKKEKLSTPSKVVDNIIGEWGIYEMMANEYIINCNVCPKIEFSAFKYAKLTLPSKDLESYEWSISKDIIKLKFVDKSSGQYLPNAEYRMKFEEHDEYFELMLSLGEKEGYILRK